jgi:cytochrome c-type biogenesis protein CcmH/NrfG
MKRVFIALLLLMVSAAGCQKKDEPQQAAPAPQMPAVALQSNSEITMLQEAVRKAPSNTGGWIRLGNMLMDAKRFAEAVSAYEKALALDPKNVDVRVDLGTCFKNAGKPDKAVEEYRKALKTDPNHLNGHRNLGIVLGFDLKRKDEAVKELEKSIELAPNAPEVALIRQSIKEIKESALRGPMCFF